MYQNAKKTLYTLLRKSERYTKTDMVYLFSGSFWLGIGQGVASLSSLILAIAFANLIPPEVFGTYKFVMAIAAFIAIPTLPGLNTALIRALARKSENAVTITIRHKLLWGFVAFITGILIATYYGIQGNEILSYSFFIAAAFVPIMEFGSLYSAILLGREQFKKHTLLQAVLSISATIALVGSMLLTNNLFVLLLAYFLTYSIGRLGALYLVHIYYVPHNNPAIFEESPARLGFHLSAIKAIGTAAAHIDRVILFHLLGPVIVAVYAIGLAPVQQIKALSSLVKTITLPKFSSATYTPLRAHLHKLSLLVVVLSLIMLLYMLIVPFVFPFLFPKYLEAIPLTQILALSIIGFAFTLNGSVLAAKKATKALYVQSVISSLFQISATISGAYLFGIEGVILAYVLTQWLYFAISTLQVILLLKKQGVPI